MTKLFKKVSVYHEIIDKAEEFYTLTGVTPKTVYLSRTAAKTLYREFIDAGYAMDSTDPFATSFMIGGLVVKPASLEATVDVTVSF